MNLPYQSSSYNGTGISQTQAVALVNSALEEESLKDLDDVDIPEIIDNLKLLQYNSTSQKWEATNGIDQASSLHSIFTTKDVSGEKALLSSDLYFQKTGDTSLMYIYDSVNNNIPLQFYATQDNIDTNNNTVLISVDNTASSALTLQGSNVSVGGNLTLNSTLTANGSIGTAGQVLVSNGSGNSVEWVNPVDELGDLADVNTSGLIAEGDVLTLHNAGQNPEYRIKPIPDQIQPALTNLTGGKIVASADLLGEKSLIDSNITTGVNTTSVAGNLTIDSTLTANGSTGIAGQVLTSNGSSPAYWAYAIAPSPVVFMVKGTSTQSAPGKITIFNDIIHDTAAGWNATNYEYEIQVAGYYKIHLQVNIANISGIETRGTGCNIYVNDISIFSVIQNFNDSAEAGTEYTGNNCDCIQFLNVNDKVSGGVGPATGYLYGVNSCLNLHKL